MSNPSNRPNSRPDYIPMSVIFGAALILRLIYWFLMRRYNFFYDYPGSDVVYYQDWAREIAQGEWIGTKTFFGLPLYPYFLAVLERLSLGNAALIRLAHLVLGSLNCVLTFLLADKIGSRKTAVAAGLLMAANFVMIYYDWRMMPVTLIVFLSLVIILAFLDFDSLEKKRERFLLGCLIGLTALGDGKMLIFAGCVLIYLLYRLRRSPPVRFLKVALPLVMGLMIPLTVTGARNKIVGGDWVWISAQQGLSFYVGNHAGARGVFDNPYFIRPTHAGQDEDQVLTAEMLAQRRLTPVQVSDFWKGQALAFIKTQPMDYLRLVGKKLRLFFTETQDAYDPDLLFQREWKSFWDFNPFLLMCPLAVIGMAACRRRQGTVYINLLLLSQLMITLIFFLTHRHRAAIFPFLIIYEAAAVSWLIEQGRFKNFRAVSPALGFLALSLCVFKPQVMADEDAAFYRWANAGTVYEKKKDLPRAREYYGKAWTLRPHDINAMYNLATVSAMEGDFVSAKAYYERILALHPFHVDALYNLGFAEENFGNYDKSLEYYRRVLALQPQSPDALFQTAQVYQKEGNCTLAEGYYLQLLHLKPQLSEEVNRQMAHCRGKQPAEL